MAKGKFYKALNYETFNNVKECISNKALIQEKDKFYIKYKIYIKHENLCKVRNK